MYLIMDMGTSNMRLWLNDGNDIIDSDKYPIGAATGKNKGKNILFSEAKNAIDNMLERNAISSSDVECIMASGMLGSESGLCEVEHLTMPKNVYELADSLFETVIPEISDIPFVIVRGLKKVSGNRLCDIMRGEETETFGLSDYISGKDCVLVLPGTHNKAIRISKDGCITDFITMMSGEMISCAINNTILSSCVSFDFELDAEYALKGASAAKENGINSALFSVRVMSKNGVGTNELTSFLCGSIISEDIELIKRFAAGTPIFVAGRENLKKVYLLLLGENECAELPDEAAASAVCNGLKYIYELKRNREMRAQTVKAIEENKVIAILRRPDEDTLIKGMRELYRAGVRLAEITFDRSGKYDKEYTARLITKLNEEFDGKMLIGAGTVMSEEDVMIAYKAGARFMISPNADERVIRLTRNLGLVSIPAAMTPTEIAFVCECGADFVKLFPANQFSSRYLKDVTAPLAGVKLLAVGGVNAETAKEYMNAGFSGIGVGSSLYRADLVREGKFDELYESARAIVESVL